MPLAPLALDLAGGLAAFAAAVALFSATAPPCRASCMALKSRVLLVNLTRTPLPARIARETDESRRLDAKRAFTRFFPAAGQMSIPLDAEKNDRLIVIGARGDGRLG